MKKVSAIVAILILVLAVMVNAEQVGKVVGDQYPVVGSSVVMTLSLYEPDAKCADWFNQQKKLVVYSRTSEDGEQTDIVRKGNFYKECFIGSDGKIHVKRCGNVVYQIAVEKEIVCPAGRNGRNGIDGAPGSNGIDGQNGRDGRDGQNGRDGRVVFVIPQKQVGWKVNPTRQFYYEPGWFSASVSALLMPRTRINNSSTSTSCGGAGGSVGDITNNNANTNPNTNTTNNVIQIGDGQATGTATGTGTGTSTAGN